VTLDYATIFPLAAHTSLVITLSFQLRLGVFINSTPTLPSDDFDGN
jgi:hypothetical protein